MPNMDGTGPFGCGFAGRRLGPCCNPEQRRVVYREIGLRKQVTLTKEDEKKILEAELKDIESEEQEIKERLKEIE